MYWFALVAVLSISLLIFWLNHDGHVIRQQAPDGQNLYMFSKLMGIVSLILLWWQVVISLLGSAGMVPTALIAGKRSHVSVGTILMICILLHVGLFMTAVGSRTGQLPLSNLLPTFTGGYYETARSLGVVALFLVVLAVMMGAFGRRYIRVWRVWHMLVVLAMTLVLIHAYLIGSEIRSLTFQLVFWAVVTTFVIAAITRFMILFRKISGRG